MDEKTLQALTALAEKLGTTAEYLWAALMRQAFISSVINLLSLIGMAALLIWWARFVNKKTSPSNEERYGEWEGAAWIAVIVPTVIFVLIAITNLPTIFSGFLNPEYWALMRVMSFR